MNKKLLLGLLIFVSSLAFGQTPLWTWSKTHGARLDNDSPLSSVKDASGNLYVSGVFEGTVNFGGTNVSALGSIDMYISKFDQNGTHLWTQTFGGNSNTMYSGGIAQDQAGNIYLTGSYSFLFVANGSNYYSAGNKDGYLIKLNSNGVVLWAKSFGSTGLEDFKSIACNGNNLYLAGGYFGSFTTGTVTLPTSIANSFDAFVIALDSSGTAMWAAKGGGASDDYFKSVYADANAVYAGGYVSGVSSFGTYTLNAGGAGNDIAFARISLSGTFTYAKRAGAASTDQVNSIGADSYGNIYIGGSFLATVNFGNSISLVENGIAGGSYGDGFVAKYDASGNCLWARKLGGNSDDVVTNISVSPNGYVYVCGYYHLTATLTSVVTPQVTLSSIGGMDGFFIKYNPSGSILWGIKGGNTSDDRPKAIVRDDNGYCFALGNFYGNLTLGSLAPISSATLTISSYIARLNGFTTGLVEAKAAIAISLYPNPTSGHVEIELPASKFINEVEVFNVAGQRVLNSEFSLPLQKATIDVSKFIPGMYVVKVLTPEGYVSKSLEIQ